MRDAARQRYASIRKNESPATLIVLLHIGEDGTAVVSGMGIEPEQVLVLKMGDSRTAIDFFKHHPPSPLEIENAIMAVEDEVTRARGVALGGAMLYSTDARVDDMARMAGCPDALISTLSIEQVESLFDQLAARSEGRPSSQAEIVDDPRSAASLLILREFMHHLQFDSIKVQRHTTFTASVNPSGKDDVRRLGG